MKKKKTHVPDPAVANWFRRAFTIEAANLGTACTILMFGNRSDTQAILSFLNIARKLPAIRFRLVLDEPCDDRACNANNSLPSNFSCTLMPEDPMPLYSEAHLILQLTTDNKQLVLSNRSILESMACSRPLIVSRDADPFNFITDGSEGFHINPGNESELLTAIWELCTNKHTYANFSTAAREKLQHYTQQQFSYWLHSSYSGSTPFSKQ